MNPILLIGVINIALPKCLQPLLLEFTNNNKGILWKLEGNRILKRLDSIVVLENVLGKEKLQEILEEYKKLNFLLMSSKVLVMKKSKIKCPICDEEKEVESFVTFDCNCRLCEDCCKEYLQAQWIFYWYGKELK